MRASMLVVPLVALSGLAAGQAGSQPRNDLPQPYRTTRDWGALPPGVKWAAVTAIEPAPDGTIYVVHRCFENSCAGRPEAPILKYDAAGRLLASFGQGVFVFPHGGTIDAQGNLWMTDAGSAPGKGHQAFKFSPDGTILMTLGKAGMSGSGPDLFDQPTDVVVAPNGDLFVTDSHRNGRNNRVVHFTKDGKYVKEWGRKGSGPGEISEPHTIAMDSRGRLFVGDRENNRIQIFDQAGTFLEEWRQFGRPSGITITRDDRDLRSRLRIVGHRHRRPRAAWYQEGHPHRLRAHRRRGGLHRGHGIHSRGPCRRRRRGRGCTGQRLRRSRTAAHARTPRAEVESLPHPCTAAPAFARSGLTRDSAGKPVRTLPHRPAPDSTCPHPPAPVLQVPPYSHQHGRRHRPRREVEDEPAVVIR